VDDAALLSELGPVAAQLLERHLAAAKDWQPHAYAPRHSGSVGVADDELLRRGVASALFVNTLTEDNLPFYVVGLVGVFGELQPWWDWLRRWTAEEMRHGMVLHQYLTATGLIDLDALERARLSHVSSSAVPKVPGLPEALVYLTLQELATRVAHWNTGQCLSDEVGRTMLARVASDENLHHLFYRDLVGAALQLDPSRLVTAIDSQVRHFSMPGSSIPGFADHARWIAHAGIYSARILCDDVIHPVVMQRWHLDEITGLSRDAERARDRTMQFLARFGRIAGRMSAFTTEPRDGAAARSDSS
jgi:acyl-[acyl-carrier-protein] desaturase